MIHCHERDRIEQEVRRLQHRLRAAGARWTASEDFFLDFTRLEPATPHRANMEQES